jgi:hypothetical protein
MSSIRTRKFRSCHRCRAAKDRVGTLFRSGRWSCSHIAVRRVNRLQAGCYMTGIMASEGNIVAEFREKEPRIFGKEIAKLSRESF